MAGGSERYAWEFARALGEGGAKVEFLTARDVHQSGTDVHDGIRIRRRGNQFSFYAWVWARLLLRRFIGKAYDVVIDAENGIPVFSPLVVSRRTVVVLIMHHVHQQQFLTYFPKPLAMLGRFLEGTLMPLVYRHVRTLVVSASTHHEMIAQLGWRQPVQVVANGADVPADTTRSPTEDTAGRVVVLGRLATHKRIDLVVRAVAELREEMPGLRLDIIGKGPEEERLRDVISAVGLEGAAHLHGFLAEDEKHQILLMSRLHVCASDAEGWGQVVIESAAYGLPTLARDVPGLRDSIRAGHTGWLLETSGDDHVAVVSALVSGIRSALGELENEAGRARYAAESRAWAAGFSWGRMREQAREVVLEALNAPPGR